MFLCFLPGAVLAGTPTFSGAIEDGKSYGKSANSSLPNATTLDAAGVPGYETATPPAASYYGNPSALGDAGIQAASANEAAQAVSEGFVSRPMFTIDRNTDPMFQRMGEVEASAASIAGAVQGEYSECQPVVLETPADPIVERCYETRTTETQSCEKVLSFDVKPSTKPAAIVEGAWTDPNSGDCDPDTWSGWADATCPSGYRYPRIDAIARAAKWKSGHSWSHDTDWQPFSSEWNARTEVKCESDDCSYRTKGIRSNCVDPSDGFTCGSRGYPDWANSSCSGGQWYTRLRLRITCEPVPELIERWDDGCSALEAKTQ